MPQLPILVKKFFLFSMLCLSLTSCYQMPTENDYCVIPMTNNPDITRHKDSNAAPSVQY